MKNLVLCFDSTNDRPGPRDATNAETLFRLLDATDDDRQITWYDAGEAALNSPQLFNPAARHWRETVAAAARESVVDAYFFLAEHWEPDDRIFLLGAGRGAYCARALARMLGTVGMMADRADNVVDYALAAYALPDPEPHDRRLDDRSTAWRVELEGRSDVAVPVQFLGLWDTVKVPGTPRTLQGGLAGQRRLGAARGRHRRRLVGRSASAASAGTTTRSRKSGSAAHIAMSSAGRTRTGRWPTSRSTGCSTVWSRRARSSATRTARRAPRTDRARRTRRGRAVAALPQGARRRARPRQRRGVSARESRLLAQAAVAHRLVRSGLGGTRRATAGARHRRPGEGGAETPTNSLRSRRSSKRTAARTDSANAKIPLRRCCRSKVAGYGPELAGRPAR